MGFFDLNIPYQESDRHVTDKTSLKGRRLKLALKAMELGFTGVAYNRTVRGVMSESHRCSTTLFPLPKLAALSSSSFIAAVKFRRELLNIPVSSPFRQYTRLTVIVDSPAQASALNPGNPILKSYDVVAVRPMNQNAFDQACQTSEVDMIAIEFSDKLPFRLKQTMVKAAIKRGVYFEITYSGLVADAQTRRQVISNCNLLINWTRGQKLIICSCAPTATELRGPQDVANLFCLLGLPMERAKAAISKNCRSLLANALRKKQFYKEAVKVEKIPSGGRVNPEQSALDDMLKWDPISSGEGDLLLEDMAKAFAISSSVKGTMKTIDFNSSRNGLPADGLQIKDLLSVSKTSLEPPNTDDSMPFAMEIEETAAVEKPVVQGHENQSCLNTLGEDQGRAILLEGQASYSGVTNMHQHSASQDLKLSSDDVFEDHTAYLPVQKEVQTLVSNANCGYEASRVEESVKSSLPPNCTNTSSEEALAVSIMKLNNSTAMKAKLVATEIESHDSASGISRGNVLDADGQDHMTTFDGAITNGNTFVELNNPSYNCSPSAFQLGQACVENRCEDGVNAREGEGVPLEKVPTKIDNKNEKRMTLESLDTSSPDAYMVTEQCELIHKPVNLGDGLLIEGSLNPDTDSNEAILQGVLEDRTGMHVISKHHGSGKFRAGRERRKRNSPLQTFIFPFKRYLGGPRLSKKKSRK